MCAIKFTRSVDKCKFELTSAAVKEVVKYCSFDTWLVLENSPGLYAVVMAIDKAKVET